MDIRNLVYIRIYNRRFRNLFPRSVHTKNNKVFFCINSKHYFLKFQMPVNYKLYLRKTMLGHICAFLDKRLARNICLDTDLCPILINPLLQQLRPY